jgi:hypothetical protein
MMTAVSHYRHMARLLSTAALLGGCFCPLPGFAQGALTPPPGSPAPTMRTIEQVEPRIPVQSLPLDAGTHARYTITQSGSYYLTGPIAAAPGRAAINIVASDVTLDLNGFTLQGAFSAPSGIVLGQGAGGPIRNLSIRNGVIKEFTGPGVRGDFVLLGHVRLDSLTIQQCEGGVIVTDCFPLVAHNVHVQGGSGGGIIDSSSPAQGTITHSSFTNGAGIIGLRAGRVAHSRVVSVSECFVGIWGTEVDSCQVQSLLHSSQLTGIQADRVTHSTVDNIFNTQAFDCTGISAVLVAHCLVRGIETTSSGQLTGIAAHTVQSSTVIGVGAAPASASSLGMVGINASRRVIDTSVSNIGSANASGLVRGIIAPDVARCSLNDLRTSGNIVAVTCEVCTDTQIVAITQSVGGSAAVTAVSGDTVRRVRVSNTAARNAFVSYVINAAKVEQCHVSSATNEGAGTIVGIGRIVLNSNVHIRDSVVEGADYGVRVTASGGQVTVLDSQFTAIRNEGIWIGTGTSGSCRLEGNVVERAGTVSGAGIRVDTNVRGFVVRNRVIGAAPKFSLGPQTQAGPIVSAVGTIASTSPWANFTD